MKRARWLWLLLLIPVIAGAWRLRFNVEVLDLLPAEIPAVQGLKLHQQYFANARELTITLEAADADLAEAAAQSLAETLRNSAGLVAGAYWQPPWLDNPAEAAELTAGLWLSQPAETFQSLLNKLRPELAAGTLRHARERLAVSFSPEEIAQLSYDPFGLLHLPKPSPRDGLAWNNAAPGFASEDGTFRLVLVQAAGELATYRQCAEWLNALQNALGQWRESDPQWLAVTVGYTGRPMFVAEIASGMERDLKRSALGTLAIIGVLFWLVHRRLGPLLWLVGLLVLVMAGTLALGGLLFGSLNVVSVGFAAILLGLAADYALVLYQESRAFPQKSAAEIQREVRPAIWWAAVTTASAFAMLQFGGLPGLGQLGVLVSLGLLLAAAVMLTFFLALLPGPLSPAQGGSGGRAPISLSPSEGERAGERGSVNNAGQHGRPLTDVRGSVVRGSISGGPRASFLSRLANPPTALSGIVTLIIFVFAALILAVERPAVDPSATPLRPRHSVAYQTLQSIQAKLGQPREPLLVIVSGTDEKQVAQRLRHTEAILKGTTGEWAEEITLPTPFWPQPEFQDANRAALAPLLANRQTLFTLAEQSGFTADSLHVTREFFKTWERAAASPAVFWPTNQTSRWMLEKFAARTSDRFFALGLIRPAPDAALPEAAWPGEGVWITGWELLGQSVLGVVQRDLWRVVAPIVLLVMLALWLAFRRWTEVLLSWATLGFSAAGLLAVMQLAGWSWNLLNLMALPLLLGAAVDYSIHMQLALRRHRGDLPLARQTTGRAILLCGASTVAGFGSLTFSENAGLASLGAVCAMGIALAAFTAYFLLPAWWRIFSGGEADAVARPSSLYRADLWRLGLVVATRLPARVCAGLCRLGAELYWRLARQRREIVIQNLLPIFAGNRAAAEAASRQLFRQFARKLVDLWRYEAGQPIEELFDEWTGWEVFLAAQARGRGVLLITSHLGNWEFGGPLLVNQGVPLHVITLAEPGRLTEMRQASRARRGIETIVIGEDAFAFVEVIQRLQAGATVALLIDRPPAPSAVTVELFGKPFPASLAAAELARASGCALLPVYVPRTERGYAAHVLPEIEYDRARLNDRAARQKLTQEIMRAFEPLIQQHADQWFHFVPLWEGSAASEVVK